MRWEILWTPSMPGITRAVELFTSGLEDMTTDILIYLVDYAMRISKVRVTFGW